MNRISWFVLWTFVCMIPPDRSSAHGLAIDVLANSETGRLFVFENFEPAELELEPGFEISTNSPGLGVNFLSNGIAANTLLQVDVTQPLLFWNGTSLETPVASLWIDNPAQATTWTVSATSAAQSGMDWATYPGSSFWDAHGLYSLDSLEATPGVYGLAMRVSSPDYASSKPFLLPLVYDLNPAWDLNAGLAELSAAVFVPASADFDTDTDIDGADFLAWQRGFGPKSLTITLLDGDADHDSDVDHYDLTFWKDQYAIEPLLSSGSVQLLPEPKTMSLVLTTFLMLLSGQNLRK